MAKKILLVFLILLIIPNIFAAATDIKIKTIPNHRILVTILVPEEQEPYKVIESSSPFKDTGIIGQYNYGTSSRTSLYPKIDIKITLKSGDQTVLNERLKNITTGGVIYINYIPNEISVSYDNKTVENITILAPANQTSLNQTNTTQEAVAQETNKTNETKASANIGTTGNLISPGLKINVSKIITYISITIILVVIIVIVIFFVVVRRKRSPDKQPTEAVKFRHKGEAYSQTEKEIEKAERKLKEAREEIDRIKKKDDLIKEAEKKLEEDRQRLEKLKGERF